MNAGEGGMKVRVHRDELVDILTKNMDAHRELFLKAQEGYKRQWIELLGDRLEDAREGNMPARQVWLQEPMDQTDDYARVIRMLEMSVEDTFVLTATEFANYVEDDWAWSNQAFTTNSMYAQS
jgi:hypothetical protein